MLHRYLNMLVSYCIIIMCVWSVWSEHIISTKNNHKNMNSLFCLIFTPFGRGKRRFLEGTFSRFSLCTDWTSCCNTSDTWQGNFPMAWDWSMEFDDSDSKGHEHFFLKLQKVGFWRDYPSKRSHILVSLLFGIFEWMIFPTSRVFRWDMFPRSLEGSCRGMVLGPPKPRLSPSRSVQGLQNVWSPVVCAEGLRFLTFSTSFYIFFWFRYHFMSLTE